MSVNSGSDDRLRKTNERSQVSVNSEYYVNAVQLEVLRNPKIPRNSNDSSISAKVINVWLLRIHSCAFVHSLS